VGVPISRPVRATAAKKLTRTTTASTTSIGNLRSLAATRRGSASAGPAGRYATQGTSAGPSAVSPTESAAAFHPYRLPTGRSLKADKGKTAPRFGSTGSASSAAYEHIDDESEPVSYSHVPSPALDDSDDEDYTFTRVPDRFQQPLPLATRTTATAAIADASSGMDVVDHHDSGGGGGGGAIANDWAYSSGPSLAAKLNALQPPRRSVFGHGASGRSFSNPVRTTSDADEASMRESWLAGIAARDRSTAVVDHTYERALSTPGTPGGRQRRLDDWANTDTDDDDDDDDDIADGSPVARQHQSASFASPLSPPSMPANQRDEPPTTFAHQHRTALDHSATFSLSGVLSPAPSPTAPGRPTTPYDGQSVNDARSPESAHSSGPPSPASHTALLGAEMGEMVAVEDEQHTSNLEARSYQPSTPSGAAGGQGFYAEAQPALQYAYDDGYEEEHRAYHAAVQAQQHQHLLYQQQQQLCHPSEGAFRPIYSSPYMTSSRWPPHVAVPQGYYAAAYPPPPYVTQHPSSLPRSAFALPTPVEPSTPLGRPYWSSSSSTAGPHGRTVPVGPGVTSSFYARSVRRPTAAISYGGLAYPAQTHRSYVDDDESYCATVDAAAAAVAAAAAEKAAADDGYRFLRSPELAPRSVSSMAVTPVGLGLGPVEMDREDRVRLAEDVVMEDQAVDD